MQIPRQFPLLAFFLRCTIFLFFKNCAALKFCQKNGATQNKRAKSEKGEEMKQTGKIGDDYYAASHT
jgi:hypothetical protein